MLMLIFGGKGVWRLRTNTGNGTGSCNAKWPMFHSKKMKITAGLWSNICFNSIAIMQNKCSTILFNINFKSYKIVFHSFSLLSVSFKFWASLLDCSIFQRLQLFRKASLPVIGSRKPTNQSYWISLVFGRHDLSFPTIHQQSHFASWINYLTGLDEKEATLFEYA